MYFYLPIYKETEEQFEKRYEKNFAKRISELEAQSGNVISQRMQMRIKDQLAKDMG